jgi:hypothetical protein
MLKPRLFPLNNIASGVLPTIIFLNALSTYIQYGTAFKYVLRLKVLSDSYIYVTRCYISGVFTTFLTATSEFVYGTVNQSQTRTESSKELQNVTSDSIKICNIIARNI